MNLTPSQLSSYLYCKRKLFLDYVLKIITPPKDVMLRGTILHKLQEKIFQSEQFIVEKILEKTDFESLKNKFSREYQKILTNLIAINRKEIDKYNLLSNILRSGRKIIGEIAEERTKIILDIIETKNVFGENLWLEIFPKIKAEVTLSSKELNLRGRVDRIEIYPDKMIPVELKTGKSPKEGLWPGQKAQVASYLLMMNEIYGNKIDEGVLFYIDENIRRSIFINPMLKDEIKDLISKVMDVLTSSKLPPFCPNNKKCEKCSLRNFCYDEKFINQKMNEKFGELND